MEGVGDDLSVLEPGAGANRFVAESRLGDSFQPKACVHEQIQPLGHRPSEPRRLELRQPLFQPERRRLEGPLVNFRDRVVGLLGLALFHAPQSAHREDNGEERGHAEHDDRPDEEEASAGIGDAARDADALPLHVEDGDGQRKERSEEDDDVP